jgi:hypothetical protein
MILTFSAIQTPRQPGLFPEKEKYSGNKTPRRMVLPYDGMDEK